MLGVFCQLLQLSKSFGPGYFPERSAPGETFENLRTEIKNPASSAGPIRLQTSTSGFARCSTEYYPVFVTGLTPSPERARLNRDRPLTLSTSRTAWEYNSFSLSVKRPLKFAEFRSVGISDLVEIRCRGDFPSIPKIQRNSRQKRDGRVRLRSAVSFTLINAYLLTSFPRPVVLLCFRRRIGWSRIGGLAGIRARRADRWHLSLGFGRDRGNLLH